MLLIIFFCSVLIYHWKVKHKYKSILSQVRLSLFAAASPFAFSILYNSFPMLKITLRKVLINLLSRVLREEWTIILFIVYYTRSIFFILVFCLIVFALLGHQFFQGEFSEIYSSIHAMSVLITNANFLYIMLENFKVSKLSIFFFIGFLLIT